MGPVYLVGAGPGDPGLLTVRASGLLQGARILVHDPEIPPSILELSPPDAERLMLAPGEAGEPVGELLAARAVDGPVVRLFRDDPVARGTLQHEVGPLARAGVEFLVVPGISSILASSAYTGIALLDGQQGPQAAVIGIGGAERPQASRVALPHALMLDGGAPVGRAAEELRAAGMPASSTVAWIEGATTPRQTVSVGSLGGSQQWEDARGPGILIVGARLEGRGELAWFERRPLFGRRVVVTRPRRQAADLVEALRELGAEVIAVPTIRIEDPPDPEPLRRAIASLSECDWVVFTSVNGVERFWAALRAQGYDTRALGNASLCAIGPATAAALECEGARADLVPEEYVAEAIVDALRSRTELSGLRILLPRAEIARPVLPELLRQCGASVHEIVSYRTVADPESQRKAGELRAYPPDLVTFTSSSTVRNYVELMGVVPAGVKVASIGPITSATARDLGLSVDIEATEYTVPGLVAAIRERYLKSEPSR